MQYSMNQRHTRLANALAVLAATLFALTVGCQRITYESRLMKKQAAAGERQQKTAAEVKTYINELLGLLPGTIEQAADRIIAEAVDAPIKRHALLWKINGIPTALRAMFHPDPGVAIIDTWAFGMQMSDYFDRGPGSADLGQWRYIALDASRRIESSVARMIADGLPEGRMMQIREQIYTWVLDHPIERDFTHRPSTVLELAAIIGDQAMDTLQTIGSLAVGIEDLTEQLTTTINFLTKQARWQAELIMIDMVDSSDVQAGLATAKALADSMNRVAASAEHLPDWLTRERAALSRALRQERNAVLTAIDAQRKETLDFLGQERMATIDELRLERLAITAILQSERKAILQAIDDQRTATLAELALAGRGILQSASQQGQALFDHLTVRFLQLLAVLLVAICILVVWLRRGSGNRRQIAD